MTETTKGACLCGAAQYEFEGPLKLAIQCYCRHCQHVSGGGHLPQVAVASDGPSSSGAVRA